MSKKDSPLFCFLLHVYVVLRDEEYESPLELWPDNSFFCVHDFKCRLNSESLNVRERRFGFDQSELKAAWILNFGDCGILSISLRLS